MEAGHGAEAVVAVWRRGSGARWLIIVASSGTGGDMQPFIALARGLRERGHRVLLLAPALQEEAARAAGLPYWLFGSIEREQAALDNPDLWHEHKSWGVLWESLVPDLDALRERVRALPADEDCVVLCHPVLVPMAALARAARPDCASSPPISRRPICAAVTIC